MGFKQLTGFTNGIVDFKIFFVLLLGVSMCVRGQNNQQMPIGIASLQPRRMRNSAERQSIVADMRAKEELRLNAARLRARQLGLPLRIEQSNGRISELIGFRRNKPLYFMTLNQNAAITTAADKLQITPYNLSGSGLTVGVWDGGGIRVTHQEFGGRVSIMDGSPAIDHSTHVGGTIGAAGVVASAKGMAPAVAIDSYDWNLDQAEMTARGASYPGESGRMYLSNHSYGYTCGWKFLSSSTAPNWEWHGDGTDASGFDYNFGAYVESCSTLDNLMYGLPYYLVFWAAGNDRNNNPANGDIVTLTPGGSQVTYNSTLHPAGDGVYRNGYDTISTDGVAKNVLCVGSVLDAVSGGTRSIAAASINSFSSWGPTDDGRIKPDLVANGNALYSSLATADNAYDSYSGTSMATPNACGSAALLIEWFATLLPGHYLRASTLKALLLHTADDLGSAGPDYVFGWGLMNVKAAAELLQFYQASAGTRAIVEDRLSTERNRVVIAFEWDGISPLRATLCWSDPPAAEVTAADSRAALLVNNLDLRIKGPDNTVYEPWVMPFVDDWSVASMSASAVTGSNKTDNVEQVLISAPPQSGTYEAIVSYAGALVNAEQIFSLIISGSSASTIAPSPVITSSTPLNSSGSTRFTLQGDNFMLGAAVRLYRSGSVSVAGAYTEVLGDKLETVIDTTGMDDGWWNIEVVNPDGRRAVLRNAFVVPGILWSEDFETADITSRGWSLDVEPVGTPAWSITSSESVSPTRSINSPAAPTSAITILESPTFYIDPSSVVASFSFWHKYDLESQKDGGLLELSTDDGVTWQSVSELTDLTVMANPYNTTINDITGPRLDRSIINGAQVWSGNSGGFVKTEVELNAASYAGKNLKVRWRLVTNGQNGSTGWYVDDFALYGCQPPPILLPFTNTMILVH